MPAVSTNDRLARRIRIGTIAALAAGGLLLLAPSASSQTVTPQSVDPLQHFIDCAGVLITAPDIHAANCLPNNIGPEMKSLGSSNGSGNPCRIIKVEPTQFDGYDDDCYDDDSVEDNVLDGTNI